MNIKGLITAVLILIFVNGMSADDDFVREDYFPFKYYPIEDSDILGKWLLGKMVHVTETENWMGVGKHMPEKFKDLMPLNLVETAFSSNWSEVPFIYTFEEYGIGWKEPEGREEAKQKFYWHLETAITDGKSAFTLLIWFPDEFEVISIVTLDENRTQIVALQNKYPHAKQARLNIDFVIIRKIEG